MSKRRMRTCRVRNSNSVQHRGVPQRQQHILSRTRSSLCRRPKCKLPTPHYVSARHRVLLERVQYYAVRGLVVSDGSSSFGKPSREVASAAMDLNPEKMLSAK